MNPLVVVQNLRKTYGNVVAVADVSFAIERGEVFGLLGPNGAGKTTTIECLTGLREPDAGEIEIAGIDVRREPRAAREKFGVALQENALPAKITPREALALFGSFYARQDSPQLLIERFSLIEKADLAFDTLSGGQRQRLSLALAFVNRPELVLLDEPTVGLDPAARAELHAEIRRMKASGHTVLLTTHYLEEAEDLCDRIAIVDQGRVLAVGSPRTLIAASGEFQSVTCETSSRIDDSWLGELAAFQDFSREGGEAPVIHFRTRAVTATLTSLMALLEKRQITLVNLTVRKATLEDLFFSLTRNLGRESGT